MNQDYTLEEIIEIVTRKVAELESRSIKRSDFSDLSLRQIFYLEMVQRLVNPTPTELAKALEISKPSVSVAIDKLVDLGYVRKVDSDEDRRSLHIHLSAKGERLSRLHQNVHKGISQMLTAGLETNEVLQLTKILNKALQTIDE